MNTCDTCRWWGIYSRDERSTHKPCEAPPNRNTKSEDGFRSAGWDGIVTGHKFGCIHHQPKEPRE